MAYELDQTTGTKDVPFRAQFPEGTRQAVVCVYFVNSDDPLPEGFETAVQGVGRGALQNAGYEVADVRTSYKLQADETTDSYVQFEVHVGKDYPDETPTGNEGE